MKTNASGVVSVPWLPPRDRGDADMPAFPTPAPAPSSPYAVAPAAQATPATSAIPSDKGPGQPKRSVCDHCRRRRIRCDGKQPCQPCVKATLVCKRDHVPLKRGPKRGRGRVINELRGLYAVGTAGKASTTSPVSGGFAPESPTASPLNNHNDPSLSVDIKPQPSSPDVAWPNGVPDPGGVFSPGEQYRPTARSHFDLMPRCVDLYYEHIYPIMPLPHMPTVHAMVARAGTNGAAGLSFSERSYLFALCALTCFHMSGQSIGVAAPKPSWESAGRFFLDECIAARQAYDFFADTSLNALTSSFWLSTSFFEINQSRKSWVYLREALTLAQDLRLHDEASYADLDAAERLCRQRMFWQLFVTERSFAVLRSKPLTLKKTPALPSARHPYEAPQIHTGFLQLISSFAPLDESFVNAWNEGSDPRVSANTYLNLQKLLALPPPFLSARTRREMPPPARTHTLSVTRYHPGDYPSEASSSGGGSGGVLLATGLPAPSPDGQQNTQQNQDQDLDQDQEGTDADGTLQPATTDIQKADLLITQQWLRLIVWQSSFRQQLLSWTAADESMGFGFPLTIASRTAAVIQSLPAQAIEVHGMGIFEKIFEIGTWSMNVLQAYKRSPYGGGGGGGFRGEGGGGSGGGGMDPLAFFVRTLSASPNSRTQFAERLLLFSSDHLGSPRTGLSLSLSPSLSAAAAASPAASPSFSLFSLLPSSASTTAAASPPAAAAAAEASSSASALDMFSGSGVVDELDGEATTAAAITMATAAYVTAATKIEPLSSSASSSPSLGAGLEGMAGVGAETPAGSGAVMDYLAPFGGDWAAAAAVGFVAVDGGPGDGGDGSSGSSSTGYAAFGEDQPAVPGGYEEDVSTRSRRSSSGGGVVVGGEGDDGEDGWAPLFGAETAFGTEVRWV